MSLMFTIDGAALRALREELGLSRPMLSRMSQVSVNTIRDIETQANYGGSKPQTVEALAQALTNVSPDVIRPEDLASDYLQPCPRYPRVRYDQALLRRLLWGLMRERGLSYAAVGELAGLSHGVVWNLANKAKPSAEPTTLYKISAVLGCKPSELSPLLNEVPQRGERELFASCGMPLGYPGYQG